MDAAHDMVIRRGSIADGSGRSVFEGDVAVDGDRIVGVGQVRGRGREEIDAKGLLVTPGFVDVHTHYDGQATWDSRLQPSSWHGVTTAVMGNCGVGFAPVRPEHRDLLVELMEGVEDIPGVALNEGLPWTWETFDEYLDALAGRPRDIDLCAQLPHAALRVYVMGERAARLEPATAEDVEMMRRLTCEAMQAGAIGFSTSRTLNHRSAKGDPTPSLRASEHELMGIVCGMRDAGRGVVEMISDFNTPDLQTEFEMIRRLVRVSGRPLSLSLAQAHRSPEAWRKVLAEIDAAVAEGLPICGQVAPRPIGVLLGLQASRNPFSTCPTYLAIGQQALEDRVAALQDPTFRERVFEEARREEASRGEGRRLLDFRMMFPLGTPPNYEPDEADSIYCMAERERRDPLEIVCDLLVADRGRGFLFAPFANFAHYNLDACGEMLDAHNTIMGLGDGGAHVGLISDASFTTYLLSHWGRDRSTGRKDLARLVKRQTADTAAAVGLTDRGRIEPGLKADLNVIDFEQLSLESPGMAYDLPAGGKRLLQRARGYRHTIVAGVETYRDGDATGALPGKLVRGNAALRL